MRTIPALLVLSGALLLSGCGGGSEEAPAPPPATTPEPAPAPAPEPEPAAPRAADAAAGQKHYALYCASCHGPKGDGDGPVSAGLNPKPVAHSDGSYMNALDDAYLTKVIKSGGGSVGKSPLMAPWGGTLSDAEIADVIAFIRTLAKPPYPGS